MRACENLECPVIRTSRKAARFDDDVMTCTHCGKPLGASFVPDLRVRQVPGELRGVAIDSLGLCVGSWCSVRTDRIAVVGATLGAVLAGFLGLATMSHAPVLGAALLVIAAAIAIWLAVVYRPAAVRLYDRGFEYQRGSVHIGIAFEKLRAATLSVIEHRVNGIRASWQLHLAVVWDIGSITLSAQEPGRNPSPDGPFLSFAEVVVRAYKSRAA